MNSEFGMPMKYFPMMPENALRNQGLNEQNNWNSKTRKSNGKGSFRILPLGRIFRTIRLSFD